MLIEWNLNEGILIHPVAEEELDKTEEDRGDCQLSDPSPVSCDQYDRWVRVNVRREGSISRIGACSRIRSNRPS